MNPLFRAIWLARRRLDREEGFTFLEVMVAVTVILVSTLALAYTAGLAFTDIALARQRQSATGLANEAIEQARGLPFDTLAKGLANWDLSGDANVKACGANSCYKGERIPTSGYTGDTNIVPLVPHRRTIQVGPTMFTVSVYVTYYKNQLAARTYTLTAEASWTLGARQGVASKVETQTIAYSPEGCLSTATHPFAAPCQPFLYGTASAPEASIEITGAIKGLPLDEANLLLPSQSSIMQVEQISAVYGSATASGATMTQLDGTSGSVGQSRASSAADNDPSQPDSEHDSATTGAQTGGTLALDNGSNRLALTVGSNDTASSASTTSATIVPSHPCPDPLDVDQNDGEPCGSSRATQAGELDASAYLERGSSDIGTVRLANIAAASSPLIGYTDRALLPEATVCAGAVGDGCLRVDVVRSIGAVNLASLPSNLNLGIMPLGWTGYLVSLHSFTDSVAVESGWGSSAPTAGVSGSVVYWNGLGYSTLTLAPGMQPQQLNIPGLHVEDVIGGSAISVDISATLTVGGTSTSEAFQTCDPACPTTRTSASATSNAPLLGTITYRVVKGTSVIADLTMQVNLGPIIAQATYQAAPSGG
jgi:type II secretory pathway pseudopilin PulG